MEEKLNLGGASVVHEESSSTLAWHESEGGMFGIKVSNEHVYNPNPKKRENNSSVGDI